MESLDKTINTEIPTLIIAPRNYHLMILKTIDEMDLLWDFDLMTRHEFISNHQYIEDRYAKAEMFEMFKIMPHIIDTALKLVPYADSREAMKAPFNNILEHLFKKSLIYKKPWAQKPLKNQLVFWGYAYQTHIESTILTSVYRDIPIIHVPFEQSHDSIPLESYNLEYDEIVALAEDIAKAIQENEVPPEKIKVHIASPSYQTLIDLIFPRFNIPYQITRYIPLWELPISKEIIQAFNKKETTVKTIIFDIYERLTMLSHHDKRTEIAYAVSNVLEPYINSDSSPASIKPMIEYDLKKTTIRMEDANSTVEVTDLFETYLSTDSYVFICGANEGEFPPKVSIASIIDDGVASAIGMETIAEKSAQKTQEAKKILQHPSIVKVSYAKKSFTNEKIISGLIHSYLKLNRLFEHVKSTKSVSYSFEHDLIKVGKRINSVMMYGHHDDVIAWINQSLMENEIYYPPAFQHKDTQIPAHLMERILQDKVKTSYSEMDDYFKCEFRFLIKHLLHVEEEKNNQFSMFMGSFVHHVLNLIEELPEDMQERHTNYETVWNHLQNKQETLLSTEEIFYLRNSYELLDLFVERVKAFHNTTQFKVSALEKRYELELPGKSIQTMTGIVDKILAYDEHFAIFDYKSSLKDLNLRNLEKGLNSQLPFYMHVVQKSSDEWSSPVGLFYHPFPMKQYDLKQRKTLTMQREADWEMRGYVDSDWVNLLDPGHTEKSFFKNLTLLKSRKFSSRAPFLSTEDLSMLGAYIHDKVYDSILKIEKGQFLINPKGSSLNQTESCRYCQFKDICYRTSNDLEPFDYQTDHEFLDSLKGALHASE